MGEFEPLNLNLNKERLATQKKKAIKNNIVAGVDANAFSMFIENALVEEESAIDNIQQEKTTVKENYNPKKIENNEVKPLKTNKSADNNKNKISETSKTTASSKRISKEMTDKDAQITALNGAFSLASKRLGELLYISPENKLALKKVSATTALQNKQRISTEYENLFDKLIEQVKKTKAGNLDKLTITLKPEHLGDLDIFFTVLEEDNKKKIFISFAGEEKTLNLLREGEKDLSGQLQQNGHSLGAMNYVLYGNRDHQREKGFQPHGDSDELLNNLLKRDNKEAIINNVDSYVANLIVNYIT